VVATQGRSFWILDNLTPLHQLGDQVASARAHLFRPRETVRYRYSEGFGGVESGRPVTADIPQFPPAGAMIDYYLASAPTAPLTLEILDARGGVVRRFSSEGPGEGVKEPEEPGMRRPAMDAVGTPKLPARAGLNRFTWDMTYPGPWSSDSARNGRNGPMAAPGTYTVRLTRGDWTASQPLVLRADPRVVRDGLAPADFSRQVAHNLLVRDLVSDVNFAVQQLRAARKRLDADSSQAAAGQAADARRKLEELERQLVTPPVRYSKPQLQSQVTYLYGMALGADQKVGRDAVERYRQLRRQADSQLAAVRQLLGAEQRSVGAR